MPTPTSTTLFPYTTLFRSGLGNDQAVKRVMVMQGQIVDAKTVVLSYRQGQNALSGHSFAHIGPGSLRQLKLSQLCLDCDFPGTRRRKINLLLSVAKNLKSSAADLVRRPHAPQPDHGVEQILHLFFFRRLGSSSGSSPP